MDYDSCRSLPAMFFEEADRLGDEPFLWAKRSGRYEAISWAEAAHDVRRLALGLRSLGIEAGERVGLVSENRPEWVVADLAIMTAGAVTVPAYVTNSVEDHRHVFADSGVAAVIVSKPALSVRVLAAANQVETVETVITIEPAAGQASTVDVLSWDEVLARGEAAADDTGKRVAALMPDDIACLIYTSGTGGTPKGVMTTHRNILANCRGAHRLLEILGLGDDVFLSFLPLSHSYEHTAGMMFPISIGAQIYFAEGAETLATNLLEARPTIMTAVPRLYETLHRRILIGVERKGGFAQKLFGRALAIGRKRAAFARLSLADRLLDPVLDRLVRAGLRRRFGGRLKAMVSGGAPLNPEIGSFFLALGVNLLQGYGQTEAGPVIACNSAGPDQDRHRRAAARRGSGAARRRRRDPGRRRQCHEGLLERPGGDRGGRWRTAGCTPAMSASSTATGISRSPTASAISSRIPGGDMISPARVEGYLTLEPEIAQAMVAGDQRPYLVAVIVPDPELAGAEADIAQAVGAAVARVNGVLSPVERVRRFVIATEAFSIANGQMTPTLKIKRHVIRASHGSALDSLYDGNGSPPGQTERSGAAENLRKS